MTSHLCLLKRRLILAILTIVITMPVRAADTGDRIFHVGFVSIASSNSTLRIVSAFWERLRELGYLEGKNLVIEFRWADGEADRLPALMAEVVAKNPDVLVTYATRPAIVAKNATTKIPIVVAAMGDPVATGLAESLARPGSNLTGLSMGYADPISGKWLELLQETVPRLSTIAVIMNPDNPLERDLINKLTKLATQRHLKLLVTDGRTPESLDKAFASTARGAQVMVVTGDPVIVGFHRARIIALASKFRMPAIYAMREFVDEGGLMAYGPDVTAMFRRAAEYVDKILKGARPSDLPIEQPTKLELVVNLKTAKALGIKIPQSILLRADEVIR
jgi:putative ABC transport system substrate-binding protein